ncbi:MAG: hypothetical protein KDF58_08100 [Alphaproteobacteria bacterium]|nr:hypothetical protein [Alphaproteobacteria bacterium]
MKKKLIYTVICFLSVNAGAIAGPLEEFSDIVEKVPGAKFLNKNEILKGFELLEPYGVGISLAKDLEYYYGIRIPKKSTEENNYDANYVAVIFLSKPKRTLSDLTRLTGFRLRYEEKDLKLNKCLNDSIRNCQMEILNLASLQNTELNSINEHNINEFIEIKDDSDNATLAYLLNFAKLPLINIVKGDFEDKQYNKYDVVYLENLPDNFTEIISNYNFKPAFIELSRMSDDGYRDYEIHYSTSKWDENLNFVVRIRRMNIDGSDVKVFISLGPVP